MTYEQLHGWDEYQVERSFGALVKGWLERCDVTDDELALEFDISRPTCARWRNGDCGCHPLMREHIRTFFEARIQPSEKP